eukprot:CAMPEP_0117491408 /NCGR_PEP_ID=MMETSP0784-20121206/18050_1 /TAXON_ID=39447 /ORGANISM="" /LENGTH=398 /DNA_ID=CAMNT_0005286195 /DNA_START=99 /DNA_END=1292 /DNA_ORIENTATION=-
MVESGGVAILPEADLDLPENDFVYLAGATDRPFQHFTGRWQAMRPHLTNVLRACGKSRPLRVVDVGSCTGFFSLQAAHWHEEADVVGVEGSVGIGNGKVGMVGSAREIMRTEAVQTHLRWIQHYGLTNCFVAPEVWDYVHVCELAGGGRPICDAMFLLSVVHHIDSVSHQQYKDAGFSRVDGFVDLLSKLLLLSPCHFVELPNKPWLADTYDVYRTQRGILEAATKASGRAWRFKGPLFEVDWFGQRELWMLEVEQPMPIVDVQSCPFPLLYRGDEAELDESTAQALDPFDDVLPGLGELHGLEPNYQDIGLASGIPTDQLLPRAATAPHARCGLFIDPGLMVLPRGRHSEFVDDRVGGLLASAPTELLLAHLALRDAIAEAQDLLDEARRSGVDAAL